MTRTGFTLIELLVVISIIAVLAGMLLPAVTLVRASAWQSRCLSNQRQCMMAVQAYAIDNDGLSTPGEVSSISPRPSQCRNWYTSVLYLKYLDDSCVVAYRYEDDSVVGTGALPAANLRTIWKADLRWPNAVACPAFKPPNLASSRTPYGQVRDFTADFNSQTGFVPLARLSADVPFLADTINPTDRTLTWPQWFAKTPGAAIWGSVSLNHRGKAVVTYADGHAAARSRSDLTGEGVDPGCIDTPP